MTQRRPPLSTHKTMGASPSAIPSSVEKAMQIDFGMQITGYLSSVEYGTGELFLRGVVFGDRDKRFDDGDPICTSIIMGSQKIQWCLVVQTLSSRYVVCDWAGDGARRSSKSQH